VCPTCYCFDVEDDVAIDLVNGNRTRLWDSCQLTSFAEVAGGENFREKREARVKHRISRKFLYLNEKFSKPFCVGCGRCNRACTAKINIVEILNELSAAKV
ncbi:MAG TPA: 4Fe-4S dicluster domain-containing protein, partial [bacterium]|nr:4Fe-4S dicluster domain-containing protein [bacterium]